MKIQEEKDGARKGGCSQGTKAMKESSHEVIKKVFPLTGCFRIIPSWERVTMIRSDLKGSAREIWLPETLMPTDFCRTCLFQYGIPESKSGLLLKQNRHLLCVEIRQTRNKTPISEDVRI